MQEPIQIGYSCFPAFQGSPRDLKHHMAESLSRMTESFRPRAVVLDLDGLMFNTEALYFQVGSELLRRRGKTFEPDLLDAMMGRPSRTALKIMIDWHALDATVQILSEESQQLFESILETQLEPMPGLLELLATLERLRMPKAVATSSGRAFAADVLGRFDMVRRFEFILTGDDVTHGKPDPEIYLAAAARLGIQPAEILVLEDSGAGCQAAVAAGTFAVAVPAGHSVRHDFSRARLVLSGLDDPRLYGLLNAAAPGPP